MAAAPHSTGSRRQPGTIDSTGSGSSWTWPQAPATAHGHRAAWEQIRIETSLQNDGEPLQTMPVSTVRTLTPSPGNLASFTPSAPSGERTHVIHRTATNQTRSQTVSPELPRFAVPSPGQLAFGTSSPSGIHRSVSSSSLRRAKSYPSSPPEGGEMLDDGALQWWGKSTGQQPFPGVQGGDESSALTLEMVSNHLEISMARSLDIMVSKIQVEIAQVLAELRKGPEELLIHTASLVDEIHKSRTELVSELRENISDVILRNKTEVDVQISMAEREERERISMAEREERERHAASISNEIQKSRREVLDMISSISTSIDFSQVLSVVADVRSSVCDKSSLDLRMDDIIGEMRKNKNEMHAVITDVHRAQEKAGASNEIIAEIRKNRTQVLDVIADLHRVQENIDGNIGSMQTTSKHGSQEILGEIRQNKTEVIDVIASLRASPEKGTASSDAIIGEIRRCMTQEKNAASTEIVSEINKIHAELLDVITELHASQDKGSSTSEVITAIKSMSAAPTETPAGAEPVKAFTKEIIGEIHKNMTDVLKSVSDIRGTSTLTAAEVADMPELVQRVREVALTKTPEADKMISVALLGALNGLGLTFTDVELQQLQRWLLEPSGPQAAEPADFSEVLHAISNIRTCGNCTQVVRETPQVIHEASAPLPVKTLPPVAAAAPAHNTIKWDAGLSAWLAISPDKLKFKVRKYTAQKVKAKGQGQEKLSHQEDPPTGAFEDEEYWLDFLDEIIQEHTQAQTSGSHPVLQMTIVMPGPALEKADPAHAKWASDLKQSRAELVKQHLLDGCLASDSFVVSYEDGKKAAIIVKISDA